jgi:hypothetical protein
MLIVCMVVGTLILMQGGEIRATNQSQSCGSGITCSGTTVWGEDQELTSYWARAMSQATDEWGLVALPYLHANIVGTNIYHSGYPLDSRWCGGSGGFSQCWTTKIWLCDTEGVVCGQNDLVNWYATTFHHFNAWSGSVHFYTATNAILNRESQECQYDMDCFFP